CPCDQPHLPGLEHPAENKVHPPQLNQGTDAGSGADAGASDSSGAGASAGSNSGQSAAPAYTPLATTGWSLVSAVLAALAFLIACATILRMISDTRLDATASYYRRIRQGDESANGVLLERRARLVQILTSLIGFGTLILWACLEDFARPMQLINHYTWLVAGLLAVEVLGLLAAHIYRHWSRRVFAEAT
ncbi:MAG: hypothetical protein LBR39_06295, partial [Coriobacteriales bacterium]|nr:hypothetical protein [Coriobacteriales bacterium]